MSPVAGVEDGALDARRVGLLRALSLLRVGLLAWACVVLVVEATGPADVRVGTGVLLLVLLGAWTTLLAVWLQRPQAGLVATTPVAAADLCLAMVVAAADHVVFVQPHPQSFASAWPMSAAVFAGILRGPVAGAAAGGAIGLATAVGTAVFRSGGLEGTWTATLGTFVLLTLAGALAGVLTRLLARAEDATARARAREEVARELHDGVLQTLAVVQRRSDDPELRRLAREQELDLRRYLDSSTEPPAVGRSAAGASDLVAALRSGLADAERRTTIHCQLTVVEVPDRLSWASVDALVGAVGEAVVNADKHGGATQVVVCLDVDASGRPTCSVLDDGRGFDPESTPEGTGLQRSVRGRLDDVGGDVQLLARPGHGCEVRLVLPAP
jgi:signal transduction histidine kinase